MASNITLSYFGPPEQKHVVKVPPMQTLSEALQAASNKFKPALVPAQCSLQYNKKPVDLHTPFRLLNVPAGSKLEILIHRPQAAAAPTASTQPQQQEQAAPVAPQPAQQPVPAAAATPSQPVAQPPAAPAAAPQQQQQQVAPTPSPPGPPPAAVTASPAVPAAAAAAAAAAGPSSSATAAGPSNSSAAAAAAEPASTPVPLAALGLSGQVYVFNQRTLEAAAADQGPQPMELDPPDDFFELTTEDLVRLQQQANEKKRHDTLFKPRAMREAESAALAASLGPIRVRLHFPDATIIQATFQASQPLSAVQQLVSQLALEGVGPALYVYTTPPKTVLKDGSATLFQLKLVPAAHLYVGCDVKKLKGQAAATVAGGNYPGPFLRAEVTALMQDSLPEQAEAAQQQQQQREAGAAAGQQGAAVTAADAQRALAAAAAASRAEAGSSSRAAAAGGGAKVPKWLKMGK